MRFVYEDRKAAEAAVFLLRLNDGTMNAVKLLKLLYLADRQAFVESGYPITGAKMVSTDQGPALGEISSCLAWGDAAETPWSQAITPAADFTVGLRQPGGELVSLSDFDEEVLGQSFEKYRTWDQWALVRFTQSLPEWKDPDGSSLPIDVRIILEEAGKSSDEIQDIASLVEGIRAMRQSHVVAG